MRNRWFVAVTLVALALMAPAASASSFKVFGAAAYIAPLSDTDISSIGNAVEASTALGWNAGLEWRFVNRIGLEFDATWADTDIDSSNGTFGSVTMQPIALNLNFHFFPDKFFDLYAGAGFAYTNFDDIELTGGGTAAVDSQSSWDLQVGADFNLGDHFAIVLGVRYYDLAIQGSGGGEELPVDPLISRIGAAWRW